MVKVGDCVFFDYIDIDIYLFKCINLEFLIVVCVFENQLFVDIFGLVNELQGMFLRGLYFQVVMKISWNDIDVKGINKVEEQVCQFWGFLNCEFD